MELIRRSTFRLRLGNLPIAALRADLLFATVDPHAPVEVLVESDPAITADYFVSPQGVHPASSFTL